MFYSGKKILVTGGLGFIGSNLARALVQIDAEVTVVDNLWPEYGGNFFNVEDIREHLEVAICDVRDSSAMARLLEEKDLVFNLAGQTSHLDSMADPQTDLTINSQAQLSMLETCREVNPGVKIVFASTRQLYGKPDYLPVDENHPIRPVDVNGINKLAGELYHLLYHDVYGIQTTVLRLTNTYGPGMRTKDARQTFLGIWIRSIVEGKPIEVFGQGSQLRDFNYVDDCVNALLIAGSNEASAGKVYNLGSDEVTSLTELAKLMTGFDDRATFRLVPFPAERQAIDIGDYYGDFSRIEKELGWRPEINLQEGLSRTIEYFRRNQTNYWP